MQYQVMHRGLDKDTHASDSPSWGLYASHYDASSSAEASKIHAIKYLAKNTDDDVDVVVRDPEGVVTLWRVTVKYIEPTYTVEELPNHEAGDTRPCLSGAPSCY
jgi:hypothetical protein